MSRRSAGIWVAGLECGGVAEIDLRLITGVLGIWLGAENRYSYLWASLASGSFSTPFTCSLWLC